MSKAKITLMLAALVLVTGAVQAQTYRQYGNTTYGSDGSSYRQYGNTIQSNDGTNYRQYGNTTYGSDGSSYRQYGNTTYGNDGSTARSYGNTTTITSPSGNTTNCRRYGNSLSCN
ncbi:hypothetical protein PMI14_06801 [Acidovorax sp. CF316]|uniref:hypothetical protein n=1 Tax=Acidovorax sp. CF316 TaxID=1144317 RepID=UPI00026BE302|nr:hypothetical protein [Acidovorax sp. CF316]EJE48773.1 hypothetical protein PMI14_06801 [Acidovorax sp. CF316]